MSTNLAVLATGGTAPELIKKHDAFVKKLKDTQEERGMDCEVLGHHYVTKPFYGDRKHERSYVFVDDVEIAMEWTSIPWNCLQALTTCFYVWVDCAGRGEAQGYITEARKHGLKDDSARVEEDWYGDPPRYHVVVHDEEDVVALAIMLFEHKQTFKSALLKAKATGKPEEVEYES